MNRVWYDGKGAALVLGLSIRQLRALLKNGTLLLGVHARLKNPKAVRPTYLWNVKAIAEVLSGDRSEP